MLTNTTTSPFAKVSPLEWDQVRLMKGLWHEVVQTIGEQTVPHLQAKFEDKDISHVLENFRICAGEAEGDHDGTVFGDGDFYKWMEAAIYTVAATHNEGLQEQLSAYCRLIAKAQRKDGYLSTKQIIEEITGKGMTRLGDINNFEIYNFGHLFTTACLYQRVIGSDDLMKVAQHAADYLETVYIEAKKKGEVKTAVCPSHYMGLIEMYRTTGENRYLDLARMAIELRDSVENGTDDNQDRIPLKDHDEIIGHAVRANYLYAGVADLYLEEGDPDYIKMLQRVWRNLLDQKIYITGGNGALYNGVSPYGNFFLDQKIHQAYGYAYQLPNITAYNETCASVGFVLWAYRMFQIEPKAEYMDWLERAMLNVNLAAVSLGGNKYFYQNMLRRTKELPYKLVWPLERTEYIFSYCCPPNLARNLAQISEYFYCVSSNEIWCGLYGANEANFQLKNGADFTLTQTTQYPYEGAISFTVSQVKRPGSFQLKIRIPAWAEKGWVRYNATCYDLQSKEVNGYLTVEVEAVEGARVELLLDMPVRYTIGHPMIEETVNQVAVERGPLVYCIETSDTDLSTLDDLVLNLNAELETVPFEIAGRTVMALEGFGYHMKKEQFSRSALYQPLRYSGMEQIGIRLIPYFAWDNRGFGEMRIWIPFSSDY